MRGPRLAQGGSQTGGAQTLERLSFRMSKEDAEMWRAYRIFKAAGLLHQWRRIYAARLPINQTRRPTA